MLISTLTISNVYFLIPIKRHADQHTLKGRSSPTLTISIVNNAKQFRPVLSTLTMSNVKNA